MFDFEGRLAAKRASEEAAQKKAEKIERDTDDAAITLTKNLNDFIFNNSLSLTVNQAYRTITITNSGKSKFQIEVISGPKYKYEVIPFRDPGFTRVGFPRDTSEVDRPEQIVDAIINWAQIP